MSQSSPDGRHLTEERLAELGASDREPAEVRSHLASCPACREHLARTREIVRELGTLPPAAASPSNLRMRARDAIQRESAGSGGELAGRTWPSRAGRVEARSPGQRFGRWLVRAAAAVVLFLGGVATGRALDAPPQGDRSTPLVTEPTDSDRSTGAAADVQRAGTAYVTAIAHIVDGAGSLPPAELAAAREVAYAAIAGATHELAALADSVPFDDALRRQARAAWLASPAGAEGE